MCKSLHYCEKCCMLNFLLIHNLDFILTKSNNITLKYSSDSPLPTGILRYLTRDFLWKGGIHFGLWLYLWRKIGLKWVENKTSFDRIMVHSSSASHLRHWEIDPQLDSITNTSFKPLSTCDKVQKSFVM